MHLKSMSVLATWKTLNPANRISFRGTYDIASKASSSEIYESYLQGSSTVVNLFQYRGPSFPPLRHRRKCSPWFSELLILLNWDADPPISLSPSLSLSPTLSPLKKKVREYLERFSSSASSSAIALILSFACFLTTSENLLSSEMTTLMLSSISVIT